MTGMGHKSPWGWGPGVFDHWPVWQGPSQSQQVEGDEEPPGWGGGGQARTPLENSGLDPCTLGTRKMTRPQPQHELEHRGTTINILKGHETSKLLMEGKYRRFRQPFLGLFSRH